MSIYKKNFIFRANHFEEFANGQCLRRADIDCIIVAKVLNSTTLGIALLEQKPSNINQKFGMPIFGEDCGDILDDRIQYGRIPDSFSWDDPNEPVVCEIFNDMKKVRFAMMSPLRLMEFTGNFEDIQ